MKQQNLIPKPPKRMKQPTKDEIRRQLEVANARVAYMSAPWWLRVLRRLTGSLP